MPEPISSDNVDVDAIIEKRIALLKDSIELKLTKEIDGAIKSRFDSTGRILGWAFGLVAIVFTAFGIKTVLDMKEIARSTAIDEVRRELSIDDPNSEFRRDIDKVVARGLIDSYLLTIAKSKGERFPSDLYVSENDFRRLRRLITDKSTSAKDFSDSLEVLLKSKLRNSDGTLDRLIRAIAAGTEEKYKWINDQPEKRAALLRLYQGGSLVRVSNTVLGDKNSPKLLKLSAIKYSAAYDKQSGKFLKPLVKHRDFDIARQAALSLARVEPNSQEIKSLLERPKTTHDRRDWVHAVKLAIELAKPNRGTPFSGDPDRGRRLAMAAETIRSAIMADFVFRLTSSFGREVRASLGISSRKRPFTIYRISSDLIRGPAQGVISTLFHSIDSEDGFSKTIRAFCLYEDGSCWGVVRVNLKNGGSIILKRGIELDNENAPGGVSIRPMDADLQSSVIVTWTDADAVSKRGVFEAVKDVQKMGFSIVVTKPISDDQEGG